VSFIGDDMTINQLVELLKKSYTIQSYESEKYGHGEVLDWEHGDDFINLEIRYPDMGDMAQEWFKFTKEAVDKAIVVSDSIYLYVEEDGDSLEWRFVFLNPVDLTPYTKKD